MWLRLDDSFDDRPEIQSLESADSWLHVRGLLYCARRLTDGLIPKREAIGLAAACGASIERLVDAGAWEEVEDGYRIPEYLDSNPTSAQAEKRHTDKLARWRKWKKKQTRLPTRRQTRLQTPSQTLLPVPVPVPVQEKEILKENEDAASQPSAFTLRQALEILNAKAKPWFVGDGKGLPRHVFVNLAGVLKAFPDRKSWETLAEYMAAGHVSYLSEPAGPTWLVKQGAETLAKAISWAANGRSSLPNHKRVPGYLDPNDGAQYRTGAIARYDAMPVLPPLRFDRIETNGKDHVAE